MGELRVWRWVFAALIACGFWNVCAEAASASLSFPRTILQIGEPRTATSLQFSTLCAAAAAKFKRHPEVRVECGFNLWTQIPNQDPNKVRAGRNKLSVIDAVPCVTLICRRTGDAIKVC